MHPAKNRGPHPRSRFSIGLKPAPSTCVVNGARAQLAITGTVRTEPWDEVIVAVGFADGATVVVLFTVNRQRPFAGTAVVPRVTSPVGVVTLMVMVLPVVTDEVPAKSQVKRLLERALTVAVVTAKVSAAGRGETCTVTVAGDVDWAPKLSRAK
ncbi:hypothetical protein EMIT0P43_130033 [Pseudomonas jessenii]